MVEHARDLIYAGLGDLPLVKVTKGDMQDSTVLGSVDVLSREELLTEGLELCLANEIKEGGKDGLGDEVLGEVEEEGDIGAV